MSSTISRRLSLLAALAAAILAGPVAGADASAPYRDGRVLVGFERGTSADQQRAVRRAVGAAEVRTIGAGTHVLRVAKGAVAEKIALLKRHPEVRYAEPDYVVRAGMTPNDPSFRKLWGMKAVRADEAWDSTTGSSGVVVGVVDTGVDYTHPDLAANAWSSAGSVNGCPAGTHGYNAITASCDPMDDNRHGTHVSGTIGAVGGNGIGVIGVNGTTRIMGLKFLGAGGSGLVSNAVTAIDWAVRAKQAGVNIRVLSNSWSGGGFSQALLDEINKAGANDILFVVAAGNNGMNNDTTPAYPCNYRAANEICVAATDSHDTVAGFSNFGPNSVDLAAPGVNVLSTVPGGGYEYLSGTSMATPHVSGAAALALSTGYQSVWTLKATVLAAVDPVASLAGLVATGGRLDVCKAIPACSGVAAPEPVPPPTVGDFGLSSADGRQSVRPGESTTYTVSVTPSGGFFGSVALSVSGLPPGSAGSFAPTPLAVGSTPGSSILTVATAAATPPGSYALTIAGSSGSLVRSTTTTLRVRRN